MAIAAPGMDMTARHWSAVQASPNCGSNADVITVMIEWLMDKERILEIYLNVIEWGDGVWGADAAAACDPRPSNSAARSTRRDR